MSRSRRKTPVIGITTAKSEKWSKRNNRRRLRAATKRADERGAEVMPHMRELSNPWLMPKDGKMRVEGLPRYQKYLRK